MTTNRAALGIAIVMGCHAAAQHMPGFLLFWVLYITAVLFRPLRSSEQ